MRTSEIETDWVEPRYYSLAFHHNTLYYSVSHTEQLYSWSSYTAYRGSQCRWTLCWCLASPPPDSSLSVLSLESLPRRPVSVADRSHHIFHTWSAPWTAKESERLHSPWLVWTESPHWTSSHWNWRSRIPTQRLELERVIAYILNKKVICLVA